MSDTGAAHIVTVQVERLLTFGLLVSLDDGRPGLTREREIAWSTRGRRRWHQRFKAGDRLQAVILDQGLDQRVELSLRLAEKDPWVSLQTCYTLRSVVTGTVTGVQSYGVFVELEPGITGLLHRSRLPTWAQEGSADKLFWVGDCLRVVVERIDLEHRQIGLSLARVLAQRWSQISAQDGPPRPHTLAGARPGTEPAAPPELAAPQPLWRVLVVEDDGVQREALAHGLRQAGHYVHLVPSAEAALQVLEQEALDLVMTDFSLPGMSGLEALQLIRSHWPALRCALMTDWTQAGEHLAAIEALRGHGVVLLSKPLRPTDVLPLLAEPNDEHESPEALLLVAPTLAGPEEASLLQPDLPQRVDFVLERLSTTTGAAKVLLFAFDPSQRKIRIEAEVGRAPVQREGCADLIYSPVRDVAEGQRIFRIGDAQQVEARVRYLKPLLAFRACLGVSLPLQTAKRYALFVFSQCEHSLTALHEEHTFAAALALSNLLEREQLQARTLEAQRLVLLGQLSRALVHELNHQLSPINFVLSDVERLVGALEQRAAMSGSLAAGELWPLQEAIHDLARGVDRLTGTAHMFGRVAVQSREQFIDLGEALIEAVDLMRDMADRAHVRLELQASNELPTLRVRAVQFQQLLLNVMVNAVQQIVLVRPAGGRVLVRVEQQQQEQQPVVLIHVEDDGPGIHRQLWEHVFELGFTTRHEGGSGLGLYIARSLAERLGARISISESLILWGTTFTIEIPVDLGRGSAQGADSGGKHQA